MPGGTTSQQAREKLAAWKKRQAQMFGKYAGYKGPQATTPAPTPTPSTPLTELGGLGYSSYYDFLKLSPFGQQAETTPAPTTTPKYPSGGYGGYGYPNYGWGNGGGVNINFGGGKSQQQIARLPTTPRPDIQGWLQSLINWNIG